jgi:hypothetical protein
MEDSRAVGSFIIHGDTPEFPVATTKFKVVHSVPGGPINFKVVRGVPNDPVNFKAACGIPVPGGARCFILAARPRVPDLGSTGWS